MPIKLATNLEKHVLSELMKSMPLIEANALCLMSHQDSSRILQIIIEELNQLEIWIGIEKHFGVMGSTLFSEKTHYIVDIANNAAKFYNFPLSAHIFSLLLNFCAKTLLNTNQADAEVENLYSEVFDCLSEWTIKSIPSEQFDTTIHNLKLGANSRNLSESGLDDSFKRAFNHLVKT